MIIIVEGVDGSGKTTLCRELAKELKLPLWIRKGEDISKRHIQLEKTSLLYAIEKFYMNCWITVLLSKLEKAEFPIGFVFDRAHLSLKVYNTFYRRMLHNFEKQKDFNEQTFLMIDRHYKKIDAHLVLLEADDSIIYDRLKKKNEQMSTTKIRTLRRMFKEAYLKSKLRKIVIDTSKLSRYKTLLSVKDKFRIGNRNEPS